MTDNCLFLSAQNQLYNNQYNQARAQSLPPHQNLMFLPLLEGLRGGCGGNPHPLSGHSPQLASLQQQCASNQSAANAAAAVAAVAAASSLPAMSPQDSYSSKIPTSIPASVSVSIIGYDIIQSLFVVK